MARAKGTSFVGEGEELVNADVKRPYSSADVCQAAGLSRATFDAWMLRKYLPLPPGPGTGRERRFSADEAVMVAIAAHLTKGQLSISEAARAVEFLSSGAKGFWPRVQHEPGWILVTGPALSAANISQEMGVSSTLGKAILIRLESLVDLEPYIYPKDSALIPGSEKESLVIVVTNVSEIARRTLKTLTHLLQKS